MIRRVLERGVRIALVLLIGVHVVLLTWVAIEKRALAAARTHFDSEDTPMSYQQPIGFAQGGAPLDFANSGSGFAVRFASDKCPFSRGDEQWKALAPMLQVRGIPITALLPSAEQAFPTFSMVPFGAPQAAYISIDWMKRYRLSLTPTLLIFDADRRLVWHREGALTPVDVKAAVRAIDSARMHR